LTDAAGTPPGLSFASLARGRLPNGMLARAIALRQHRSGRALDLGAGPMSNARLLLDSGLYVDAVDNDPHALAIAAEIGDPRLRTIDCDIRDFEINPGAYCVIAAIHVFPFFRFQELNEVLLQVKSGLAPGGLLCCTFLGRQDGWALIRPHMTFLSRSDIEAQFVSLRPLLFRERTFVGPDAEGVPKRWHIFQCAYEN
jgi:SAM-dependent methyltransferase